MLAVRIIVAAARVSAAAIAVIGTTALLVTACGHAPAARSGTPDTRLRLGALLIPPAHRHQLPAISGTLLSGRRISLPVHDRVTVINVWASWCTECRAESVPLARVSAMLPNATFVGIDEQDTATSARRFLEHVGIGYEQLPDTDGAILAKIPIVPSTGIPSTVIVDRRGRMAARIIGKLTESSLLELLNDVMAGH